MSRRLLLLTLLAALAASADAHDYPTVDRVQYVEACIRDHPERQRQEMIYKCSCVVDALALQLSYEDFVEASTAAYMGQAAGERGTAVRESAPGKGLMSVFSKAQKAAFRQCMIE
jgi:hypothetical protein